MPTDATNPAAPADATGFGKSHCLAARDDPGNTKKPKHIQAAIADLRRDFIAECLRIAAIKAAHAADNIEIRDDVCAERDIRFVVDHVREAAASFRALECGE
jgi:hypothetical protein